MTTNSRAYVNKIIASAIVVIIAIQLFMGKYSSNLIIPVIWLLIVIIPYIYLSRKKFTHAIITVYLIVSLGSILSQPILLIQYKVNPIETLTYSLIIIIPLIVFLMIQSGWPKQNLIKENDTDLLISQNQKDEWLELVSKNKLLVVSSRLKLFFKDEIELQSKVIIISRQVKEIEERLNQGVIREAEYNLQKNKLTKAVLDIINNLKTTEDNTDVS